MNDLPPPELQPPLIVPPARPKAKRDAVQWLLVVILACATGLLTVYLCLCAQDVAMIRRQVPNLPLRPLVRVTPQKPFQITADDLQTDLQNVIQSQLTAFRQDDYPTAYTYAASQIKAQVSLPAFERMVKKTYPAIAHYHSVRFGTIVDNGDTAVVNVIVSADTGVFRKFQYFLQREPSGWKISGVFQVKSDSTTA